MHRKIALIIGVVSMLLVAAYAQEIPAGYEWSSPMGALRKSDNPQIYVFDTTAGNYLTDHKETIVQYKTKPDKGLSPLGVTLKGKLLKIDGVADVAVEYRRLWIQKFPLDSWEVIMPELQKVLK